MKTKIAWVLWLAFFSAALAGTARAERTEAMAALIDRIEVKVTKHLQSYFLTRPTGTGAYPANIIVDITVTRPVDDHAGRFLTTGKATIIYNESAPNYVTEFEVTCEVDDQNVIRVTDMKTQRKG